jgi:heptosyltransferase-1
LKILLVKLSSLGDVVHAMPAMQDICRALPEAQIDWVVERGFAPLVQRCKGIHRVIACDLRGWRHALWSSATRAAWRSFRDELQSEPYDAVIDLQGLTKSAWVSWLARLAPNGKRFALANQTEGSSYEAPTRWVCNVAVTVPAHSHAVVRARELCARALAYRVPGYMSFGLLEHVNTAQAAINSIAIQISRPNPVVALVHGTSRADKQWPLADWLELGRRLNQGGYAVALPHGSEAEQRFSQEIASGLTNAVVWPRLALDALLDHMAACAGVIGVDSGLSHLALALDLPQVQIYNFNTAWRTGPLGLAHQRSVFGQPSPSLELVWQGWQQVERVT